MSIANLNDALRRQIPFLSPPHQMVITRQVGALPEKTLSDLFRAIRTFNNFSPDNDPYKEHDCAVVDVGGEQFIWKFDYFDDDFQFFKENGNRVLTIMHTSEY